MTFETDSKGLTVVIIELAEILIGQDPRPVELITANLYARTRQAPGGLIPGDRGHRERDRLRRYWSHCGTYRLHHAEKMGLPPIRTLDDIVAFC
jgi:galactonate dehydratase